MDPVEINGNITDSNNLIICNVQTDKNGFGLFTLNQPVKSRLYFRPVDGSLTSKRFVLPPANDSGVAISVTEEKAEGIFRLRVTRGHDFNINERNCTSWFMFLSLCPRLF